MKIPGNVLTCEMSFLMGRIVRGAIRSTFASDRQQAAITSAESAYFKTFDDQSKEEPPEEMKALYGNVRLGEAMRAVLALYAKYDNILDLTSSLFVSRIKGDPRMKYEIVPTLEECRHSMLKVLLK